MSPSWHGQNFQFLSYIPNLVLEPFFDLKLFVCWPFYFKFGLRSWFADIWAWACSDFHFGKIFHFFWYWTNLSAPNALVKCCNLFFETLHTCTFVMCSSDLCKKNCVFGHCLKLHAYFELCTSHHFVNVSFGTSSLWSWAQCDEHVTISLVTLCLIVIGSVYEYVNQSDNETYIYRYLSIPREPLLLKKIYVFLLRIGSPIYKTPLLIWC